MKNVKKLIVIYVIHYLPNRNSSKIKQELKWYRNYSLWITVNKGDCANREKWINSCPSHLSSLIERENDNCTRWVWFHCPAIDFTLISQDTSLSTTVHRSLHLYLCRNKHDVINFNYNSIFDNYTFICTKGRHKTSVRKKISNSHTLEKSSKPLLSAV